VTHPLRAKHQSDPMWEIAKALHRVAKALEETAEGRPVLIPPDPCRFGHQWHNPMFYEPDRRPYCRRCGLRTHG
jgi:hypothetical protein